ncbi:hypothetical protein [Streptomyces sp. NPDC002533]
MTTGIRTVQAGGVMRYADGIRDMYASAFAAPPWNEDPAEADAYAERLARDALRPGFTAAVATADGTVTGFATAWITPQVFPADRSYGQVAEGLKPVVTFPSSPEGRPGGAWPAPSGAGRGGRVTPTARPPAGRTPPG